VICIILLSSNDRLVPTSHLFRYVVATAMEYNTESQLVLCRKGGFPFTEIRKNNFGQMLVIWSHTNMVLWN